MDFHVLAAEIVVTSANNVIRVEEDTAGTPSAFDVELTAGSYWLYGDGTEANDFCKHLADRLTAESAAHGDSNTYTVAYVADVGSTALQNTGAVTVTSSGTTINFLGGHANQTFDNQIFGFANATSGPGTSLESALSPTYTWCSNGPAVLIYPSSVSGSVMQHRTQEGQRHTFRNSDTVNMRRLAFSYVEPTRVWLTAGYIGLSFEAFWDVLLDGKRVQVYKEQIATGTDLDTLGAADLIGTFVLSAPLDTWEPLADSQIPTFGWEIELATYVS